MDRFLVPAFVFALLGLQGAAPPPSPVPSVAQMLEKYARAAADPGLEGSAPYEAVGKLSGAGLSGVVHEWNDGERRRIDQSLGPRFESTLRVGSRFYGRDSDGDVREYTGVLLRRERTDDFVESGAFAKAPERCVFRGRARIANRAAYVLEVSAPGGDTETVYLDPETWLPVRYAYDEDDALVTIDLSDWHSVGGRRFAFRIVGSNGDHEFDEVEQIESVTPSPTFAPDTFALEPSHVIDMDSPQTIALTMREGHLFLPVTLAGKRYTFMLDSGSQNIVIDERVAREAGIASEGRLEAAGTQRTGGLKLARIPALGIGDGTLRDLVVTTLDLARTTGGTFKIDGILGFPFFAQTLAEIDPAKLQMRFGRPGSFAARGARVPVQIDRSIPEATFELNGSVEGTFLVDTGNAGEVLLYRHFLHDHPGVVPFSQNSRRSYGIGGATESYRTSLDALRLGDDTLYHADTDAMQATSGAFADRFDAGNVGLGVLKNFVVTFAFSENALYLERGSAFDDGRDRH